MSYILDALNRSNSESVQDPRALLAAQTVTTRGGPVVPILLASLLAVNVGLGAWWLWQNQEAAPRPVPAAASPDPAAATTAAATTAAATTAAATTAASRPPPQAAREVRQDASAALPSRPAATPSPVLAPEEELITPATSRKPGPIPIGALPRGIQEQIPDLAFSSHIYAEDPALRMVNINGELYRQGDTIARGVKLLEITEDGAVLAYLHYTFEVGVLEDWAL